MNDVLEMLLLGTVQGVTEWLPVSSEGVSTLVQLHLFDRTFEASLSTAIWLHVGTLLAAVVYFRHELARLIRALPDWAFRRHRTAKEERVFLDFLLVATLATGAAGVPLLLLSLEWDLVSAAATALIGVLLIVTGLIQLYTPRFGTQTIGNLNWKDAGIVGIVQGLAALPGLSRSGFTVAALLLRGYGEAEALKISFIMSIPVIAGVQILLELQGTLRFDWAAALAGVLASAIVGWATIAVLIKLARRLPFWAFAVALGVLSLTAALIIP